MGSSIHLIFGDEYLAVAKAKQLVAAAVPDPNDSVSVEVIDGQCDTVDSCVTAIGRCREGLSSLGLFGGARAVWLRGVSFLIDTPAGRSERVKAALARLADMLKQGLPDGVALVISAARVDKRTAFYKQIKELGVIHEFAVSEKSGQLGAHAEAVIAGALEQCGITMAGDVRQAFQEKVGSDTRTILGELQKLATYVGARKAATVADIEAITSPARDAAAWDIQDAVGRRELARALSITRRLLFQRESPMALIALIENRLRDLIVLREAMDRGWLQVSGRNARWGQLSAGAAAALTDGLGKDYQGTHPYRLWLLCEQAQCFSGAELARAMTRAMGAHRQLVSSSVPGPLVLELLLVRMLSKSPARAQARA
ncbi:MAG: DNA polymerase III subunit delta [Verrucomicrobia bacterium]|nr:DNA polymerase III subunit delta [Verrucomicrobiota bacterium]